MVELIALVGLFALAPFLVVRVLQRSTPRLKRPVEPIARSARG